MEVKLNVELMAHTPVPEEVVAMGARLCYSSASIKELKEKDVHSDYIRKLVDMGHFSPIEHCSFTFGVEGVSRALLAQITRHRIASFSVQSQRYVCQAHGEGTFSYIVPPSICKLGDDAVREYHEQMRVIQGWYNGWCERLGKEGYEDARFVLPNAAETKIIMTMNARELLHFFNLRCCNRAQWEIRELAWEMLALVQPVAPAIFRFAGPKCVAGGCGEGRMSCGRASDVVEKRETLWREVESSTEEK